MRGGPFVLEAPTEPLERADRLVGLRPERVVAGAGAAGRAGRLEGRSELEQLVAEETAGTVAGGLRDDRLELGRLVDEVVDASDGLLVGVSPSARHRLVDRVAKRRRPRGARGRRPRGLRLRSSA